MDNQKVQPLWEPNVEFPALRKPSNVPNKEEATVKNDPPASNLENILMNTNLSADAKEFYPAGFSKTTSHSGPAHSVQDRLRKYNPAGNNSNDFNQLHNSLELITMKPGSFDDVVPNILDNLYPYFNDVKAVEKIAQMIFNQALKESTNFTYLGARLCAILDEQCPLWRGSLHQLCNKQLEQSSTNISALTLFFAEIYTQMDYELFGKCLLNALEKMLGNPTPENVKYICQTLKLSGGKLDKLNKEVIDKILNTLSGLNGLPSSMVNLVGSVVTLRSKQWGMADSFESAPPPAEPVEWSDEPIFYGPDGQQLTLEECDFLTENLSGLILDGEDPDELYNPEPEMNEEIQAAFAEFVRMGHR